MATTFVEVQSQGKGCLPISSHPFDNDGEKSFDAVTMEPWSLNVSSRWSFLKMATTFVEVQSQGVSAIRIPSI